MNLEQIYKAWHAVGADAAGLMWEDFVKALAGPVQDEAWKAQQKENADYAIKCATDVLEEMTAQGDKFKSAYIEALAEQLTPDKYNRKLRQQLEREWVELAAIRRAEQPAQQEPVTLEEYDAGLLNDFGGGNVEWWQDYIRAELGHAHEYYQSQMTSPQPAQQLTPEWQPMDTAPRDGTIVRLNVLFEDHSLEDGNNPVPTIGANHYDNNEIDEWQFAGWNWSHDCFTEGVGKPIGWLPMLAAAPQPAPVQQGPVAWTWELQDNGSKYFGESWDKAEQPAQQQPVAWMEMVVANLVREGVNKHKARELAQHFYTSPPAQRTWVGLTDADLETAMEGAIDKWDIAEAIEAKLKEKNNG